MANILVLDDDEMIRVLLDQMLQMEGHSCEQAANCEEARNYLKTKDYELILCDIKLPGESGMDFIKYVTADYKDTATIIVSGINDAEVAKSALRRGIYDYIMKPVTINRLSVSVANALRRRQLEIANRTYKEDLERMIVERTAKLQKTLDGIVRTMALTVESRDPYTAGHQKRVADLACAIAIERGLSKEQIEGTRMAGTIHDLGKISVPAEVLSKPSQLSQNEFNLIKDHPQVGFDILKEIEFPWPIAEIVLQHHERFDGSGYPQGLAGDEILIEARIIAVADVVEAMASHRPYRPGKGVKKALSEITNNKGMLYDPDAVDACLNVFKQKKFNIE
jgi:response regulator RpfG family c-di-GMP phosphodiesterase